TELAVTVYLIPVPPTPPGEDAIGLDWLNGNSHTIVQGLMAVAETEGQLQNVIFISGNQQETVKLSSGSSDFTALSVFFERNLAIYSQTHLTLRSKLLVFNGFVELQTHNNPANYGRLALFAGEDGIDGGSFSGGIPGEKYGRVDFVQGLFLGDRMLAEGAYYFPDGISLPDDYGRLVPVSI
ncbi:MAG TPA: hypothetical protein GX711_04910, partial [Clostridia bacterium]|nr:hypothetical protein [Clostridia bacterium]